MSPYSSRLIDTLSGVVDTWLHGLVDRLVSTQNLTDAIDGERMRNVVADVARELMGEMSTLLGQDAWDQRRNPLELVRSATATVTVELASIGARPVARDEFKERSFPTDVFDLAPATWTDIHPDLHEVGLEWGAWKAASIVAHRRSISGGES